MAEQLKVSEPVTMKIRRFFGCVSVLLALAAPVAAHHSTANFDSDKTTTVTGVVSYVSFTNPHSFIDMDVVGAGGAKQYKVFATSKVALLRYGWTPDSVKPGDTITIEGRPDRTDPTQLYLLRITFADGTKWSRDDILQ